MRASKVSYILSWGIGLILVVLPFHAFFTTWLGANFGHLDLFRIWKELLIVPLGLAALWLLWRDKLLLRWLLDTRLFHLIVIYIMLFIVTGVIATARHQVNANALIYAWLADLRFIV